MDMAVKDKPKTITDRQIRAWAESGEPRAVIDVLVTPEIAKVLLEFNRPGETNRNLSTHYLNWTVEALRNGLWNNTGEPIIMSDAGLLNDGQHRLNAIVESGLSAIMDLRFGISRSASANTNSGRKRSGSDALKIAGHEGTARAAAVARNVLCYVAGLPESADMRVSNGEVVAAVERWPDIATSAAMGTMLKRGLGNAATFTLAFFAGRTANAVSVQEFFAILRTGEGAASNPPHVLREWFIQNKTSQGSGFGVVRMIGFANSIIAWNAWRRGQEIRRLGWRPDRPFPVCHELEL